ncbi:MAG: hypothetical protein J7527_09505 [Chitinophagaceae bacterium]|nr:hypothetical protein [Chitinophagaceae bacterium]
MNDKKIFPENLTDFLYWIKEATEEYWCNMSPDLPGHNAKWLPLTDQQIDELEQKYSVKFGIEHRQFLRVLHTTDKTFEVEKSSDADDDIEEAAEEKAKQRLNLPNYAPSLFYNWLTEKDWIEYRLSWIREMFIADIIGESKSWLRSWGPLPETDDEKISIFNEWYGKAPRLLPITAHTFLMSGDDAGSNPVLSVMGFDTIIRAWSLRHFLIREFADELGLVETYKDEDHPEGDKDLVKGIPELDALQKIRLDDTAIPYWKEVLTYYHSHENSWQSFWE